MPLSVEIGDTIRWKFMNVWYREKVIAIDPNGDYCVNVVYKDLGLTQDKIEPSFVKSVYRGKK